jgi:DNA polymerase-3 subunit delta
MKIYPKKIDLSIRDIVSNKIKAILLYGPDQGMVSTLTKKIISAAQGEVINLSFNEINDKRIKNHILAQNLFGTREILKVTNCTATLHEDAKKSLIEDAGNTAIFIADELTPSSSLRKFFETEPTLLSIACYPDEELDLKQFILNILNQANKRPEPQALEYLKLNLKGDQSIINQELEKLITYIESEVNITLNDVEQVISPSLDASADFMCYNFAGNNAASYFTELTKLYNENISPVWIIRALIRFYSNLYTVKLKTIENTPIEEALKGAKPPIFFKYVADFKKLLASQSISKINQVLEILLQAESISKTTGAYGENICEELFFKVNMEE